MNKNKKNNTDLSIDKKEQLENDFLSIIVPVYNEEKYAKESIIKLLNTKFVTKFEVIAVNDGSKDKSFEILNEIKQDKKYPNFRLITKKNQGKGSAIICGIKYAKGNIITIHDSDLEYDPKDLSTMLKVFLSLNRINKKYALFGSRFLNKNNKWMGTHHIYGNYALSLLTSILNFKKITDMETCYKMFYKKSIKNLYSNKFEIEPEITIKLIKNKYVIKEIPINYYSRSFKSGKKINIIDGIKAIISIIKFSIK